VPGGDFGELLHRGHVISPEGVDPVAERAELRAGAASQDPRDDAPRRRSSPATEWRDHEVRAELDRAELLRQLAAAHDRRVILSRA
jgi:hypothetical protein